MKNNLTVSLAVQIAFVGFITQFGGGFASGAQIYQYFLNYGMWGFAMPVLAQALLSLFYWYGMRYAFRHQTYDYRSFCDGFYGRFKPVFSNLYEIEYFVMVCMAPAVAFATGGSTLQALTGLPYIVCTLIIGVFILVITVYGTDIVRKCSSVLSVAIILGLLIILIPNIIVQWETIVSSIHEMGQGTMPYSSTSDGSFGSAFASGCTYGIFQLTAVGLMFQHVRGMKDEREVGKSMFYMFIVDTLIMLLAMFGLAAVAYIPELASVSVPMLLMVQKGVGSTVFTPVISVLIILGAVSTGVNMIAGIVERMVKQVEKKTEPKRIHHVAGAFIFTAMAFLIAQFGLIPLVKTGYSYIGYATLIVIVIPFIVHAVYSKVNGKD